MARIVLRIVLRIGRGLKVWGFGPGKGLEMGMKKIGDSGHVEGWACNGKCMESAWKVLGYGRGKCVESAW
jgi:hypothetical protein